MVSIQSSASNRTTTASLAGSSYLAADSSPSPSLPSSLFFLSLSLSLYLPLSLSLSIFLVKLPRFRIEWTQIRFSPGWPYVGIAMFILMHMYGDGTPVFKYWLGRDRTDPVCHAVSLGILCFRRKEQLTIHRELHSHMLIIDCLHLCPNAKEEGKRLTLQLVILRHLAQTICIPRAFHETNSATIVVGLLS